MPASARPSPRPWSVDRGVYGHRSARVLDAEGVVVCTFDDSLNLHDEDVANAELIVAAVNAHDVSARAALPPEAPAP